MKARKYEMGGKPPKPTIGGQQTKQTRVEQGVYPIPGEYDMTTAEGRKAYSDDRAASRENRKEREASQRTMTVEERNADNKLQGKQSQARVTTGASPAKIVIGGGKGVQINPDLKAAAAQRAAQTKDLRPKTSSSTYQPKGPIGSRNR